MRTGPGLTLRITREYQPANRRENNITRRRRFISCLLSVAVQLDAIFEDQMLLPLDFLSAISTLQISDPAPVMLDCQLRRHRRVRCIWFVRRISHL